MDFKELGLALKEERERQGLSIGVVMESTKISRTNIVAIENGDRSSLPHPVYARGFIKSYARFLGLDAEELAMVVDREYVDQAGGPEEHIYEVSPAAEKAFHDRDTSDRKKRPVWPWLLILACLVVAGVLIFMNFKSKDSAVQAPEPKAQTEQPADMTPPAAEEQGAPAVQTEEAAEVPAEMPEVKAEETAPAAPVEEPAAQPAEIAPKPTAPEKPAKAPAPTPTPAPAVKPVPEEAIERGDDQTQMSQDDQVYDHVLIIRATTEKGCWIGVWKGDETDMSRDFVLREGEPLRLLFNSPRRIRIGNVAGVSVIYNGQPYQLDATKSNIQTLRFGY